MEGKVYYCQWVKEGRKYRVSLPDYPDITATGSSLGDAEEEIVSKICELLGDGEPLLSYPKVPSPKLNVKNASYMPLMYPAEFMHVENREALLDIATRCPECDKYLGIRNEMPARLNFKYTADVGVEGKLASLFVSHRLKSFLDKHSDDFEWRECETPGRKRYWELLSTSRMALEHYPSKKDFEKITGVKIDETTVSYLCPLCNNFAYMYWTAFRGVSACILSSMLPNQRNVFALAGVPIAFAVTPSLQASLLAEFPRLKVDWSQLLILDG